MFGFKKKKTLIEVPVFGKVVRANWYGLRGFREFPFLRQFAGPDPRCADGQLCINHLGKEDRAAVEDWKNSTEKLAVANDGLVGACLSSYGVYDLYITVPDDGLPSKAQEAAYQQFLANEENVCAALLDALIRYYKFARETQPQWFEWMDSDDLVENPDVTTVAKLATFCSMTVCHSSAKGVSPLQFSWSPIWEEEHGFQSIMHQGEVIMMGTDTGNLVTGNPNQCLKENEEYGIWGINQMTKNEKDALDEFVSNCKHAQNMD